MSKFAKEQQVFDISGVKIGGQPGQLPTVMIGSMFYRGDKLVTNEREGIFDKEKAISILKAEEEISQKTGNPRIVDPVAAFSEAIVKYIDFIADTTDSPFLIDGITPDVRIAGVKHVQEVGLQNRAIYNTITPETKPEEIACISESKINSAVILTFNAKNPSLHGRLDVLDGLLNVAKQAHIENFLVDAAILDIPDPGPVARAIYIVKEKYGLPAGCGAHNAIDLWSTRKKLDPLTYLTCSIVANVIPISMGANFLLYGPVRNASKIYQPVAVADAYMAYAAMQESGLRPATNHPIFKVFRTV